MKMIKLNFVPENLRKERSGLFEEGLGQLPKEVVVGIIVAVFACLLAVHLLLGFVAVFKIAHHQVLELKWGSMSADRKVLDDLTNETKTLQTKMNALRPIASVQGILWAKFLNDVSDSVPKGVWLRGITYEKGTLMISGSAVSKVKSEMIIAGNFVSALKEKPGFKENFLGIDVDSIQRRENSVLSIADFLLKAKRK